MQVKRYHFYLAELSPTIGSEINKTRPVVVVSMDEMNQVMNTVVVCPLTTKLHPGWRSRIQVVCNGKQAEVAVDQIRTISKIRLIKELGVLSEKKIGFLCRTITEMYGE